METLFIIFAVITFVILFGAGIVVVASCYINHCLDDIFDDWKVDTTDFN